MAMSVKLQGSPDVQISAIGMHSLLTGCLSFAVLGRLWIDEQTGARLEVRCQ